MGSRSVLVVDDEMLIRWSVAARLDADGLAVLEAENGVEARAAFCRFPDAVLLDIKLPDANGLDLLVEFLALRPDCPIVIMTAHGSDGIADEAKRRGAVDLIHKPFDIDDVAARINRLLGLQQSAAPGRRTDDEVG